MIDVAKHDLLTIQNLLEKHVPECEVRAFGSRVSWTAKDHSDLDLVIVGSNKLTSRTLDSLKEAFDESSLPFRVDVLDWHRISSEFQQNIEKSFVVIKKPTLKSNDTWGYFKVSEFAEVIGGGTPKTEVQEYWNGKIPWITPKDLSNHQGRYIARGERNITDEGLKNSSARIVPANTVLLTSRAPVGYLAIAKNPITTNQGFRSLIIKEGFSAEFIYYLLLNNVEYLKQHASGSTFQELSGGTLKNLDFRIPDLASQKTIAKILSDLDTKIELNQQMNKTLETMAQALFKQWFVDFEFPDAKGRSYKSSGGKMIDSELGEIPEGWSTKPIGEAVQVVGGSTPSTKNPSFWEEGTIHWATPKDMSSLTCEVLLDTERRITDVGLREIGSGLLPVGAVLLSSRAPIGYLAIAEIPVAINQGFIGIICDGEFSSLFIKEWIKQNLEIIKGRANGTTFQEISKSSFRPIPVVVPSREIIKKYNLITERLYRQVVNSLKQTRLLMNIRDSILPKLMSGKIRVKEI